jgi:hypothetical protein
VGKVLEFKREKKQSPMELCNSTTDTKEKGSKATCKVKYTTHSPH